MDLSKVALVELHDAKIVGVAVDFGGRGRIEFSHMSVYVEVALERYDVWSCAAELSLSEVSRVSVSWEQVKNDVVIDGACYDAAGRQIALAELLDPKEVHDVALDFASGASVKLRCTAARLERVVPNRKLEEWSGPLAQPP